MIAAIATSIGLDGPSLVPALDTAAVKDRLRAYTDEAVAAADFRNKKCDGVVITGVDASSAAADKRLVAGSVIVAIEQEQVGSPADVQAKVDALKKAGKKTALLLVALAVGLLVSIVQAATQINEMTLSFIPKLVALFATMVVAGPWMITMLTDYMRRLFSSIPGLVG